MENTGPKKGDFEDGNTESGGKASLSTENGSNSVGNTESGA